MLKQEIKPARVLESTGFIRGENVKKDPEWQPYDIAAILACMVVLATYLMYHFGEI